MFQKLKQRWGVSGSRLLLIICTFAIGGSACGWLGRQLLGQIGLTGGFTWILIYILLMTLLWPVCVLVVSIPMGQFGFFKNYLSKIWKKMSRQKARTTKIAICASGAGSNAATIIRSSKMPGATFEVALVVCNKPGAGVIYIAEQNSIPVIMIEKHRFMSGDAYLPELSRHGIDFIVLAGFLWKVPVTLIRAYPDKIINIHPALLPAYGGKGMYGARVHAAVIEGGEKESGISIHYVDEIYDHGKIIFQATCPVSTGDTADTLAKKIHELEHQHYPQVIADLLKM